DVYEEALKHFGAVESASLKVASAEKGLAAAKGQLYPQLTLNAQVGSNYATTYKDYGRPIESGTQTIGFVDVMGLQLPINTPQYTVPVIATTPFVTQFGNNFRQTYSVNLGIP